MTTRLGLAPMIGGEQYDVDRAAIESNRSFDEASGMLNRDLERRGINPNSGRFAGAKMKLALRRAASEAGAKTRAYNTAQDRSFNRLMQLIAMGRNGMLGRQTALGPQMLPGHTVGRATDGGGGGDYNARVQQRVLELGGQAMGGGAAPLAGGNPRVIPLGSNPRAIGMAPLAPPGSPASRYPHTSSRLIESPPEPAALQPHTAGPLVESPPETFETAPTPPDEYAWLSGLPKGY